MDKSGKRFVSLQAMKLSELQPGQTARILFVGGKGAFRKRILEMGFLRGKEVTLLQAAIATSIADAI